MTHTPSKWKRHIDALSPRIGKPGREFADAFLTDNDDDDALTALLLGAELALLDGEAEGALLDSLFYLSVSLFYADMRGSGLVRVTDIERDVRAPGGEGVETVPAHLDSPDSLARRSALVGTELRGATPIVTAPGGYQLQRRAENHANVLAQVQRILDGTQAPVAPAKSREISSGLSDEQRAAVGTSLQSNLALITGGPGTGKTFVAAAVLQALLDDGYRAGEIALCAPTGKAAYRLAQSLRAQASDSDDALLEIAAGARTLHRLLGYSADGTRHRHHRNNPISEKVVLLDESSMVSMRLFRELLNALPEGVRLIMSGDPDQLPPVEPGGAVFTDLIEAAERGAPIALARLTYSFRVAEGAGGAGVLSFARSLIEKSDATRLQIRSSFDELSFAGTEQIKIDGRAAQVEVLAWIDAQMQSCPAMQALLEDRGSAAADTIESALRESGQFQVLCAFRHGADGSTGINEAKLRAGTSSWEPGLALPPGTPVIVRSNDYDSMLFNGDTGVVARNERGGLAVYFESERGVRGFQWDAISTNIEPAWAITIHKSQGSEYDRVCVTLGRLREGFHNQQLVYTAVTRAKEAVLLLCTDETLSYARDHYTRLPAGLVDDLPTDRQ